MNIPSLARTLLERFSRGKILKRRLPDRFGGRTIFVTPDAALSYWRRDLDSVAGDLFKFVDDYVKRGDVVWDVGASLGIFSLASAAAAGSTGKVYAMEPDAVTANLLRRSAKLADLSEAPIHVLCAAVTDAVGLADLKVAERGRSSSYVVSAPGATQGTRVRDVVPVVTVTLDWLLERIDPPDVVKIDVETAELHVLRGANRLLDETRPVIYVECCDETAAAVTEALVGRGYSLFDFSKTPPQPVTRAAWACLALPST